MPIRKVPEESSEDYMGKKRNGKIFRLVFMSIIVLVLGYMLLGCYSMGNSSQNQTGQSKKVALYFSDGQAINLVPEEREINYDEKLARRLVEELVKGPQTEGLFRTLPQTTKVLSVQVKDGIAYVDLTQDFEKDYPGGTTGEGMALGSIIQTLTEVENINAVQFLIAGKKVEVLAKGHVSLSEPLERHFILGNIETGNEKIKERQELVETGQNKWLLDPLETARVEGPLYGLYALGEYELSKKTEQGEYSGIGEAQVRHSYKGEKYEITMIQPDKQGMEGIWIINSILPYGTQEEALFNLLENKIFQPSQNGKVFSVYEVLGENNFDNRKTLYIWALCKEYIKKGDTLEEEGGLSIPLAVTLFAQDENHNKVLAYQVPQDGEDYWSSIEKIFPQKLHDKISKRQGNIEDLQEVLKEKAEKLILN
jgi:uncharacterized protein YrzB (UPF0473 family)